MYKYVDDSDKNLSIYSFGDVRNRDFLRCIYVEGKDCLLFFVGFLYGKYQKTLNHFYRDA